MAANGSHVRLRSILGLPEGAIMPPITYQTSLQRKMLRCEDTGVFRFDRPFGYSAAPGQWFRLTLDTQDGPQTKTFSDAAAPDELEIDLVTRLSGSAFKRALLALRIGDRVTISGPGGRLRAPDDSERIALLMGGVGIAPGRAILRDRVRRADGSAKLCLFEGSNDDSCVVFGSEFDDYAARLGWFELVSVIADPSAQWTGEAGLISADVISRHIEVGDGWHFLVAGPPAMTDAMRGVLAQLGVSDDRATFETFSGYA